MSNSIWKTPDQKPKKEELVAWEDRNGIHAGRFDTCYNCFCACADYYVDLQNAIKWCSLENLDDLITKAERLQKQLDSLKKYSDSLRNRINKMLKKNKTLKNTAANYFMKSVELGIELEKTKSNN